MYITTKVTADTDYTNYINLMILHSYISLKDICMFVLTSTYVLLKIYSHSAYSIAGNSKSAVFWCKFLSANIFQRIKFRNSMYVYGCM